MGTVRALTASSDGVPLGDAVATFLDTISVANTRRGYAAAYHRLVVDFGADSAVGALDPDRLVSWFTSVWGHRSAKTFNTRLTALGSALRAHSRRRSRRLHTDADGAVRAYLGPIAGYLRPGLG